MSKIISLVVLLILNVHLEAQETVSFEHGCAIDAPLEKGEFVTDAPGPEAEEIVKGVFEAIDLAPNFILRSANCNRVVAVQSGTVRYLLYNPDFLKKMKEKRIDLWVALGTWVHAIGHHLNKHDFHIDDERGRKKMELEADQFTGTVLYRLGAEFEDCKEYINFLGSIRRSESYPPFVARREAILNGWKKARNEDEPNNSENGNSKSNGSNGNENFPATSAAKGKRRYSPSMANFLNARFPFPPPDCHTSHEVQGSEFSNCSTLGDVATKIESALKSKKYPYKFMSVPGGMAIVAQMEQYNESGAIVDNGNRWQDIPKQEASVWSVDYYKNLIFPNKCFLRVFVFLVVDQNWTPDPDSRISKEAAQDWYNQGVNRLPIEMIEKPFTSDYGVSLLVYEFEVPEANHTPEQNCPAKFQAIEHYENSGLKSALSTAKANSKVQSEAFDLSLKRKLTGLWVTQWYGEAGQLVANKSYLNKDNTLMVENYINGTLQYQNIVNWEVKNGYFVEHHQGGIYVKYQAELYNDNTLILSFLETNGTASVPLGTIFTYTRM